VDLSIQDTARFISSGSSFTACAHFFTASAVFCAAFTVSSVAIPAPFAASFALSTSALAPGRLAAIVPMFSILPASRGFSFANSPYAPPTDFAALLARSDVDFQIPGIGAFKVFKTGVPIASAHDSIVLLTPSGSIQYALFAAVPATSIPISDTAFNHPAPASRIASGVVRSPDICFLIAPQIVFIPCIHS
jgi:hypothetical protein